MSEDKGNISSGDRIKEAILKVPIENWVVEGLKYEYRRVIVTFGFPAHSYGPSFHEVRMAGRGDSLFFSHDEVNKDLVEYFRGVDKYQNEQRDKEIIEALSE